MNRVESRGPNRLPLAPAPAGVAAAGAGGVHNLVQSNWIRDKGFGIGAFIARVASSITGEDQAEPATGYIFSRTGPPASDSRREAHRGRS